MYSKSVRTCICVDGYILDVLNVDIYVCTVCMRTEYVSTQSIHVSSICIVSPADSDYDYESDYDHKYAYDYE